MMNTLLNIYFKLPHDKTLGVFTKVFNRLFAKILKQIFDRTVPNYFLRTQTLFPSGLNTEKRDKQIILSLTSFPGRIEDLWIVVECLFRQNYKADKIILWLSESQFKGINLPKELVEQQKRGLDIRYVRNDLKSHKKYIYAFNQFKYDYIITVDDDLYYDNRLIENLIILKEKYPNALPTNRAHLIRFESNQEVSLYSKWFHNYAIEKPSLLLVPTGGFGTMYDYNQLHHTFYDESLITELAPSADDLWLKVQSLLKNTPIITNSRYNKDPITVKSSQLEKLVSTNVLKGGNDLQLSAILTHFNLGNLEKFVTKNE
jgi:hypothetical protein